MPIQLPSELWIKIFRAATRVQQLLDLPPYDYFAVEPVLTSKEKQRLLRQTYPTKLYFVQVCKMWYTLGQVVLYEAILISSPRSLRSLTESFVMQSRTPLNSIDGSISGAEPRTAGVYTKRIEFASRVDLCHLDQYAQLIPRFTPNLQIFVELGRHHSGHAHQGTPPSFVSEMAKHCASSLRVLEWKSSYALPPFQTIDGLLRRCRNLRSLLVHGSWVNGRTLHAHLPDPKTLKDIVSLGSCVCLQFSDTEWLDSNSTNIDAPNLDLPNLIHLHESNHGFESYAEKVVERTRMLQVIGRNITTIETHYPEIVPPERLQQVLDACPRASTLILDVSQALEYYRPIWLGPDARVAHRSICRVGLRSSVKQLSSSTYRRLSESVTKSRFPSLRIIKILTEHISFGLQALHQRQLWLWSTALEQQGVLLLQWNNESFVIDYEEDT